MKWFEWELPTAEHYMRLLNKHFVNLMKACYGILKFCGYLLLPAAASYIIVGMIGKSTT